MPQPPPAPLLLLCLPAPLPSLSARLPRRHLARLAPCLACCPYPVIRRRTALLALSPLLCICLALLAFALPQACLASFALSSLPWGLLTTHHRLDFPDIIVRACLAQTFIGLARSGLLHHRQPCLGLALSFASLRLAALACGAVRLACRTTLRLSLPFVVTRP